MHHPGHGKKGVRGVFEIVIFSITWLEAGVMAFKQSDRVSEQSVQRAEVKPGKHLQNDMSDFLKDKYGVVHFHKIV